jgi:hypothetical protein
MRVRQVSWVLGIVMAGALAAYGQIPMPDAREMSGIPRPVTDLPDGTVSVRVIRGALSNNIVNQEVELHGPGERVWRATTDDTGRAQFTGVPGGTMVHAVTTVTGERLESQAFPVPSQGGIRLMLVATASTEAGGTASSTPPPAATPSAPTGTVSLGGDTRFVVEMGEDGLNVFYLFEITNSSAGPVDLPAPLTFEMPAGAQGTTVLQSTTAKAAANGTRVTATGPFAPGRTTLELAYTLPYAGGRQTIDQTLPAALGQLSVIVI